MLAFPVFYHAQNLKCTDNISGIYTHLFTKRKMDEFSMQMRTIVLILSKAIFLHSFLLT